MLTKRCCDCRQAKRVELFDIDSRKVRGRSAQCKECRRQRQTRGGYSTSRNRALAELARRHQVDWHRYCQQLCAAHPDWPTGKIFLVATHQHRRAHRTEILELMAAHAGARPAGPGLLAKINRPALRLLQLAHPEEYQALYAAERARISSPIHGFTKS
jgi:hypothetical protein